MCSDFSGVSSLRPIPSTVFFSYLIQQLARDLGKLKFEFIECFFFSNKDRKLSILWIKWHTIFRWSRGFVDYSDVTNGRQRQKHFKLEKVLIRVPLKNINFVMTTNKFPQNLWRIGKFDGLSTKYFRRRRSSPLSSPSPTRTPPPPPGLIPSK